MIQPRSLQLARLERPVRYLLVLLAVALVTTSGCASHAHGLDPTVGAADGLAPVGLKQTASAGELALLIYAGAAVVILGAFVVDLFLLPFAAHHHDFMFPCCQAVIHACH